MGAAKVEGLKKNSAASAFTAEVCASVLSSDSTSSGVKPFSKFDGQ